MRKIRKVNSMIFKISDVSTKEAEELDDAQFSQLRTKIQEDFEGCVLGTEPPIDPPVRGRYGYAFIPLKCDAMPTRSRPFVMHG